MTGGQQEERGNRRNPWILWAILNLAGICLIALPDSDQRLFSFSRTHGPAPADFAGALLLIVGWAILDAGTWKRRRALWSEGRRPMTWSFLALAAAGMGLIVWSVANDQGMWWLLGALVVAGVQIGAAAETGRHGAAAPLRE